ncbi:hypothetical protein [Merdibacter massiliensis]|uniref:hypothetical protein n=1 Tax=Merdibacter massiliensis TaxID=1871030 RepID=UPI00096A3739|nr:hypothetical protein [Merdibacter massiliensis]
MEKIETFEQTYQYLKEGEIVCYRDGNQQLYCGMRNEKVHINGTYVHYVLEIDDFVQMFSKQNFYLYKKQTPVEISKEKDEEYYSWQHK